MEALNAVIAQKIEVSSGLFILRIVPDGWELPEFSPGQFAVIGLPGSAPRCQFCDPETKEVDPDKMIKRAYSIASPSVESEYLELYVALVPSGELTPRLMALEPGSRLWLSPKIKGLFTLADVPVGNHIVLLGTGTGLAPYMSMLRSQFKCGSGQRVLVLHGARHSWDLGYRSELRTLARMCDNFDYIPCVSRPEQEHVDWGGHTGHVQHLWNQGVVEKEWGFKPTPENTHIFLCGNPLMIEDAVTILDENGFKEHKRREPGQVHLERYW